LRSAQRWLLPKVPEEPGVRAAQARVAARARVPVRAAQIAEAPVPAAQVAELPVPAVQVPPVEGAQPEQLEQPAQPAQPVALPT
jgi:hypothetical protein